MKTISDTLKNSIKKFTDEPDPSVKAASVAQHEFSLFSLHPIGVSQLSGKPEMDRTEHRKPPEVRVSHKLDSRSWRVGRVERC